MATAVEPDVRSAQKPAQHHAIAIREKLLIVGGGMAANGLCRRLVDLGIADQYQITIFGDEKHRSYDRVNLSKFFDGKGVDDLLLSSDDWYDANKIDFLTGHFITKIDRDAKVLHDSQGRRFEYDQLVLATGSRAWMPPIEGHDSPGVFVYRTLADLEKIKAHVQRVGAEVGAVIGGGLLGLESAKVLVDLGLQTSVIEMAPGLMPRQLDNHAAARLKDHVESIGVDVHLVRRTEKIVSDGDGRLTLHFNNAEPTNVDILIVAAGVRANDQLAKRAGLAIGNRGGIVVDYRMQTCDRDIFAIGECAAFDNHIYGLVAPCYQMADVLARRLAGEKAYFLGADESAELKLLGIPVVVLGRAIGQSASCVVLSQEDEGAYRKIIMEQGRFAGAACVGHWEELPLVRDAIRCNKGLWPMQRARFEKTGSPWPTTGQLSVNDWPDTSIVCSCLSVTKVQLTDQIALGVTDVEVLAEKTRASTACGSCQSLLCELAGNSTEVSATAGTRTMMLASLAAACFLVTFLFVSPIQFAQSVQDGWRDVDVLWRSDLARQITGYTTLSLTLLGLVFSLRKRFDWFQWGSYGLWRAIHGVLGAGVLIALAVHTGFSLGANLNFILAIVFLGTAAFGSAAGIVSSMESRATGTKAMTLRLWRPRLTHLHLWLFWPLPALIAIHVFSFYWFSD
ncbi:FAD-dependent oxidoreductase [Planctomycetes bacterium K23_9]|uniref:Assimilatory nitrate reductase electron transfer subunit n=1 Tax=Stieleria marina TaxID=1930275 RepID=A0A517P2X0_9BACT|nr:Assimilatory nitrate reductase electron transfer subunit [Planctomycetes bacterium K23_9]